MIIITRFFVEVREKQGGELILKSEMFYKRKNAELWADNLHLQGDYDILLMSDDYACLLVQGSIADEYYSDSVLLKKLNGVV